jgi:hypothetical protein
VPEAGDTRATLLMVAADGTETIVGRFDARGADLVLVDVLARLELAARRHGLRLCLRDAPDDLCALIDLAGLAGVLAVETWRKAEVREQLGVEEVLEPPDAPV